MEGSGTVSKPEPAPVLLTVGEAAAVLRCSPATVYRHVGSGVLPAVRGGVLPAVRVGGLIRVPPSALAPFASWAIAGGVQLFYLARIMGTSVAQIDGTYGHLLPDSEDYLRGLLDAYDATGATG